MSMKAVYPGTFDPFTNGHLALIERAAGLFDQLVVAIATSERKQPMCSLEDRLTMAELSLQTLANVTVEHCDGLLVDFARQHECNVIVRGLRAVSDFDYEFQLAGMNRQLSPRVETIFLPAVGDAAFISGTMVREVVGLGGDVRQFVPPCVLPYIMKKEDG